jgi:hypothetical protein
LLVIVAVVSVSPVESGIELVVDGVVVGSVVSVELSWLSILKYASEISSEERPSEQLATTFTRKMLKKNINLLDKID